MKHYAEFECEMHPDLDDCADAIIRYNPKFDEYGIPIKDGGMSRSTLSFCPYCGVKLPESKRDEWFDRLEAMGVDPWEDDVPEAFKSDTWWREPLSQNK